MSLPRALGVTLFAAGDPGARTAAALGLWRILLFAIFTLTLTAGAAGLPRNFPLAFEERTDGAAISYVAQGTGYRIALRDDGARIRLAESTVSMRFAGARKAIGQPEGEAGRINRILGNDPRRWRLRFTAELPIVASTRAWTWLFRKPGSTGVRPAAATRRGPGSDPPGFRWRVRSGHSPGWSAVRAHFRGCRDQRHFG